MVSLEVVQLLDKVVPKWLTWSFQGSESPFNLTVPNSVLSLHPKAIHIVFDLAGSGSVLNIRSLCVGMCSTDVDHVLQTLDGETQEDDIIS